MSANIENDEAVETPQLSRYCRFLSELSPQPMVAVEGITHVVLYLNPAFARLVKKEKKDLIDRPFAAAVPEGEENGCLALLDRVFRSGIPENLAEQEHRQTEPQPVYWSYAVWAILGLDDLPTGVMIQVTDSTETALFRQKSMAMNEALVLSSVRQHELVEAAGLLNSQLREAQDQLEGRVAERTAELAAANALLKAEISFRELAEASHRDLLQRLTTAQEDERRRIARDLHDEMGQDLSALIIKLQIVKDDCPDPSLARDRIKELKSLTDQIGRDIHNLAVKLRPTALDDLGVQTALAHYVERWSAQSRIAADYQVVCPDNERPPMAVETVLYRVVQEALTNVFRHSKAQRVSVVLQLSQDYAIVVVEDNGVGFDLESTTLPMGDEGRLGLLGMQERVTLVGGILTFESTPGRGTTVIARVPLPIGKSKGKDV